MKHGRRQPHHRSVSEIINEAYKTTHENTIDWLSRQPVSTVDNRIHSNGVHNRSQLSFSPEETHTLSLGLKFIPTPRQLEREDIKQSCFEFERFTRIRWMFQHSNKRKFIKKFHIPKPEFQPKIDEPKINQMLAKIRHRTLATFDHAKRLTKPNLTLRKKQFLKTIRSLTSIVIKPADKNLGITILDKDWYVQEAMSQLADSKYYTQVSLQKIKDTLLEKAKEIEERLENITYFNSSQDMSYLKIKLTTHIPQINKLTETPETTAQHTLSIPKFYLLPKIHKSPMKGRPIVSSYDWITTPASIWVDHQLQPFVRKLESVIKDSKSLVQRIENTTITDRNCTLFTADISSLYTNIPITDGMLALRKFLVKFQIPNQTLIITLMEFILMNNFFEFNEQFFQQLEGTAMGTPAAPTYANIYLYITFDLPVIEHWGTTIILYKRYLDDLLIIISSTTNEDTFSDEINKTNEYIKLTSTANKYRCEFLDLVIYKDTRFREKMILDTTVHQKQMNKYLYIPYISYHGIHVKKSLITTEMYRYIRNCSDELTFLRIRQQFYQRLRERGYPRNFLTREFQKYSYKLRPILLAEHPPTGSLNGQPTPQPFVFKIEYNPAMAMSELRKILQEEHKHLITTESMTKFMPKKPILALKKSANLFNILCTAKLTKNIDQEKDMNNE